MSKTYPEELQLEIIQLLEQGIKLAEISAHYGIAPSTIRYFPTALDRKRRKASSLQDAISAIRKQDAPASPPKSDGAFSLSNVLAIPDLHCPFQHIDALAFLKAVATKYDVNRYVCLGDEIDAHAYSKWPKDPDGMGPGQELKAAIEALIPFYVAFPTMQVCISNHTVRPHKMMKMVGLPAAFLPAYSTMLNAPDGWSWHEHVIIDGVRYMHGDQGKGGLNGWTKNSEVYHQSVVVGHWHSKAGVYYDSKMFNVNAGCLIDDRAYAFDYAKNSHKRPNLGCAVIFGGTHAQFIPMITDEYNRWVGKL